MLWAVVIRNGDFAVRPVPPGESLAPDVIAYHADRRGAELALERVIAMNLGVQDLLREPLARETELRTRIAALPDAGKHPDLIEPRLRASLEHEVALRNGRLVGVFEIARPRD